MWPRPCVRTGVVALAIFGWASGGAAETVRIDVDKLTFIPAQVSAHVGDSVEWVNADFVAHTATARNKAWDVTIPAKGVGRVTLKRPGVIDYYCRFHPNMVGRIEVAE
jgi:plastocyanin